jgi:uncharacterized protein YodC (DUF2158 family)
MAFKTGDSVTIKDTSMTGTIVAGAVVDDESTLLFKVQYTDQSSQAQERFFKENELVAS